MSKSKGELERNRKYQLVREVRYKGVIYGDESSLSPNKSVFVWNNSRRRLKMTVNATRGQVSEGSEQGDNQVLVPVGSVESLGGSGYTKVESL